MPLAIQHTVYNKILPYGIDNRASLSRTETIHVSQPGIKGFATTVTVPPQHTILIHNIDVNPSMNTVLEISYGDDIVWGQKLLSDTHRSIDPHLAPSPNISEEEVVTFSFSTSTNNDLVSITYSILYVSG